MVLYQGYTQFPEFISLGADDYCLRKPGVPTTASTLPVTPWYADPTKGSTLNWSWGIPRQS